MNTLTAPSPFLQAVAAAGDEAARADRHRLASLVAELASGRRPSITAEQTGELLRRLNMPPESLEELVATRQRLNVLREQAAAGPEARAALKDATATYSKTIEEITKQEQELRSRREVAEGELRRARGEVEQAQVAGRAAADSMAALLDLLHPALQHDLRTAGSGIKIASSKITELRRRIGETESELATAADATYSRPEAKAPKLQVLQDLLERLRRELAEVEEQHERARREHERLAAEVALLVGEECTR